MLKALDLTKGNPIKDAWNKLHGLPLGSKIFGRLVSLMVPYTGSLGAKVIRLEPGYAEIQLKERRAITNHLSSIHAIALANLAEYTGNLAFIYSAPDDARFIVAGMSLRYLKKARGTITASASVPIITSNEKANYEIEVSIADEAGDVVCVATLDTRIGPVKKAN